MSVGASRIAQALPGLLTPLRAEGPDAPADAATPYALAAGESFGGTLAPGGDADWIALPLAPAERLSLIVEGWGADPVSGFGLVTALRDEHGTLLSAEAGYSEAASWLDWVNPDDAARLVYLEVAAFSAVDAGGYAVARVTPPPPSPPLGADAVAERLTAPGPGWGDTSVAVDLSRLDPAGLDMARAALSAWSRTTGLAFEETALDAAAPAGIVFDDTGQGAYTTLAREGTGGIAAAWVTIGADIWQKGGAEIGGHTWLAYLHEIGHALGLADAGGGPDEGPAYGDDHWQLSVMSAHGQPGAAAGASWAVPLTPMPADLAAVARLYGDAAPAVDDTLYGPAGTGGTYDGLADRAADQAAVIVDAGGHDRLDLSSVASDQRIDLTPGAVSDIAGLTGNLALGSGTVIEDASGGAGDDTVFGNGAGNRLDGATGSDRLDGGGGDDRLDGGPGDDILTGGAGADEFVFRLQGGADRVTDFTKGEDRIRLADSADPRIMLEPALGGVVLVAEDGTRMLLDGVDTGMIGSDDFLWSRSATPIFGTTGVDRIEGSAGDDVVYAGTGEDDLWVSAGNDTLDGGGGIDTLHLPRNGRSAIDLGTDLPQAIARGHVTLRSVENLVGGRFGDTLSGTGAGNVIEAMGGWDIVRGRGGMDILIGGKGRDKLYGGADRMRDVFVYETIYDSKIGTNRDVIYDFESGIDDIDLTAIDANVLKSGDQAFRFTGPRAAAHSVWTYDIGRNLLLRGDVNGDARHDFEIEIVNVPALVARDLLL